MSETKQPPKQVAKDYALMTLATLLICVGVYFFKFPNNFSTGGVSGLSIILGHYVPGMSAGAFVFVINQALLVLGFLVFGRSVGARTAYVSILMSSIIWILEYVLPMDAPLTTQPLLELVFSVTFPAVGSAILFNMQASSGGTDIVAMILKRKKDQHRHRQLSFVRGPGHYVGRAVYLRLRDRAVQHSGPGAEIRYRRHGAGKHQGA